MLEHTNSSMAFLLCKKESEENTMKQQEFYEAIQQAVKELLGETYSIGLFQMQTVGMEQQDALFIRKETQPIFTVIYLQEYYQQWKQGKELEALAKDLVLEYRQKSSSQTIAADDFKVLNQQEAVKQTIFFRCVSKKQVPSNIPHRQMLDFAILYGILIKCQKEMTTFVTITKNMMECYHVTEEELFDLAMENTPNLFPESVKTLQEVIASLLSPAEQTSSFPSHNKSKYEMLVLSNIANFYGFSAVFYPNVLKQLAEERKGNLIVIPSSIHEAILLTDSDMAKVQELNETIVTVNETQLTEQERLSNQAYYYDRETKSLYFMEDYKKGERGVCVKF